MRRLRFILPIAAAALTLAIVAAASARPSHTHSAAAAQVVNCKSPLKIAMVTPLTGGAGFLGNEQLSWAKYAVKTLQKRYGLKIQLLTGDTPVEQGPAPAQALAQKFIADPRVVAILGPSTSGAVAASSAAYFAAGLVHVSESATRTQLTKPVGGQPRQATAGFFRVVADDGIQGPNDANYMISKLKVKKVAIFDFQEPYSQGIAADTETTLKAKGVTTTRLSAPNTTTDYSSYVSRISGDTDVVFVPTQKPGDAQTIAEQLAEQGKKAKVFGTDGSNNPAQFKFPGSYVSNFAAPISLFPYNKAIIAGWKRDNPGKEIGSFGPPTYGATQVIFAALQQACARYHGKLPNRRVLIAAVKRVRIHNWILGGDFRFSTKTNDPFNGRFYIFQIQSNGTYKLVQ
jgi:branched-chain amino acid transport system substrate-binding protein